MKLSTLLIQLAVFHLFSGWMGAAAWGGSSHISGSIQPESQSVVSHISGAGRPGAVPPPPKHHVSGAEQVAPANTASPIKKKAQNKTVKKERSRLVEQAALLGRAKLRKACWARCEQAWENQIRKQCAGLAAFLRKDCDRKMLNERLQCVRQTCRNLK